MRVKPTIADDEILSCLQVDFAISARDIEFLPLGADGHAWSYRVDADDGRYFLKVRRGVPAQSMLVAPDYLKTQGIDAVVAPLRTPDNRLYVGLGDYALIAYPFVEGGSAWEEILTDAQMQTWGDIMRRLHAVAIPTSLQTVLRTERYISPCDALFKRMNRRVLAGDYDGDIAIALAEMWRSKIHEIEFVYNRHLALGDRIKRQNLPHVMCHADIHQANLMLDHEGRLRIVDWDGVMVAPKERDLMFFDVSNPDAKTGFFAGYQNVDVNRVAIAYYRYEWVVQEFAEWAAWILDTPDRPEREQAYAVSEFKKLFSEGDVIDVAHQAFELM
jgi:spectinomycin phosphotransferase